MPSSKYISSGLVGNVVLVSEGPRGTHLLISSGLVGNVVLVSEDPQCTLPIISVVV